MLMSMPGLYTVERQVVDVLMNNLMKKKGRSHAIEPYITNIYRFIMFHNNLSVNSGTPIVLSCFPLKNILILLL